MGRPKVGAQFPISLSIPINEDIKERLSDDAGRRGIPLATHARILIMKGLSKK